MNRRTTRLPFGYHIVKGATGRPRGGQRKPYDGLGRTGRIERAKADLRALLGDPDATIDVDCSGPEDWARERREREEAMARVNECRISRGWGNSG